MSRQRWITLLLTTMLVSTLMIASWAGRQQPAYAQQPAPHGQLIIRAKAGTSFTYQGRLLDNGNPVNDTCQFVFILWDAETGGNSLATSSATATVSNGYFNAEVDFGESAFAGEARWMSVRVRCPANVGAWQDLQGRIPLRPAPHALYAQRAGTLLPGATVVDKGGTQTALYAQSGTDWQLPLLVATKVGGLWGDSRYEDGVIGTSQHGNGVYGYSETGKAVYADGDAHVEGNLTWKAKASAISVAPAMFVPNSNQAVYRNGAFYLQNLGTATNWWSAGIQLPHGATITQITACWEDGSAQTSALILRRRALLPFPETGYENMGRVESRGAEHSIIRGCKSESSITNPAVDNKAYAYFLDLYLPKHEDAYPLVFLGAVVEYTVESPY